MWMVPIDDFEKELPVLVMKSSPLGYDLFSSLLQLQFTAWSNHFLAKGIKFTYVMLIQARHLDMIRLFTCQEEKSNMIKPINGRQLLKNQWQF